MFAKIVFMSTKSIIDLYDDQCRSDRDPQLCGRESLLSRIKRPAYECSNNGPVIPANAFGYPFPGYHSKANDNIRQNRY